MLKYLMTLTLALSLLMVKQPLAAQEATVSLGDYGLIGALEDGLVTPLNLTQSNDRYDVELEWAYADANRLSLLYSVFDRQANQYLLTFGEDMPQVYTSSGEELTDAPKPLGINEQVSMQAMIANRDLSALDVGARESFTFVIPTLGMTFDFEVPVLPLIAAQSELGTFSADGVDVTFNALRVSPTITQATFCYPLPDERARAIEAVYMSPDWNDTARQGWFHADGDDRQCQTVNFSRYHDDNDTRLSFRLERLVSIVTYTPESVAQAEALIGDAPIEVVAYDASSLFGSRGERLLALAPSETAPNWNTDEPKRITPDMDDVFEQAEALNQQIEAIHQELQQPPIYGPWGFTVTLD